jgi:phenylpropionate dioxygenase-like ring-hydroxylating dioxygenase large terminal subunit
MLFVCFDAEGEDLISYLGNAREYLDYMLDFGGSQAYSMKANWKLLIENSIDGYHAMATHHRYFVQYLTDIGADTTPWVGPRRQWGTGLAPQADHQTTLFLIADDWRNLASRVRKLLGGTTWGRKSPLAYAPAGDQYPDPRREFRASDIECRNLPK